MDIFLNMNDKLKLKNELPKLLEPIRNIRARAVLCKTFVPILIPDYGFKICILSKRDANHLRILICLFVELPKTDLRILYY